MFINIKYTPNPNSIQFFVEKEWNSFYWECKNFQEAQKSPLTKDLWDITGVVYTLIGKNFIVVNKNESHSWDVLMPIVMNSISDFLFKYDQIFPVSEEVIADCVEKQQEKIRKTSFSDLEQKIYDVLEEKIQPGLAMHGGGVQLIRFEDGVLFLELTGACVGCPSSSDTIQYGISNILHYFFPEIEKIEVL